jgi:N-acetylglucosamine-6-phosphate deacetylase
MNTIKAIKGSKIILENEIIKDHVLLFDNDIKEILSEEVFEKRIRTAYYDRPLEVIGHNGYVSPGFIDIHVHGAGGSDTMDATPEALRTISENLIKSGTTGFLATTMTMSEKDIIKALETVRSVMSAQENGKSEGSDILGVHLEGPFINPKYKGAQAQKHIQKPTAIWLKPYFDIIKIITFAPEMDTDFEFIKAMAGTGIVLSIGHTGCDFETACSAHAAGVDHITHCFNAMTGLHHRKPGVVGAAFAKPFTTELIADGIHVHPGFFDTFVRIKSPDKVILVTDAIRAGFLEDGTYELGGQPVIVEKGASRLEDGTLAGSILKMNQALENMLKSTGRPLNEVVSMMSINPARRIGLDQEMGSIEEGKLSNLVLLSEDYHIEAVYIKGKKRYDGGIK